jgi:p38 MAP kinase
MLTSAAVALLEEMLQLDPEKRCSAAKALDARYLSPYHDSSDEPVATETFDMSFLEANLTADAWKMIM